jgi:hypothetical protein
MSYKPDNPELAPLDRLARTLSQPERYLALSAPKNWLGSATFVASSPCSGNWLVPLADGQSH